MKKVKVIIFIFISFLGLFFLSKSSVFAQTCQGSSTQNVDYQACNCSNPIGNYCDGTQDYTQSERFICNWANAQKTLCGLCAKDTPYQLCNLANPSGTGNQCKGNCTISYPPSDSTCASLGYSPGYSWYSAGGAGAGQNCSVTYPTCSQNTVCGACIPATGPTNTCGIVFGTQACQQNQPQPCNTNTFTQGCQNTYNSCSANYTCPNPNGVQQACVTNINVHVYVDYNHDGVKNGNDAGYSYLNNSAPTPGSYAVVSDGGGNNINANTSGNVTFTGKTTGNYTISLSSVPTGYAVVGSSSQGVSLTNTSGNATVSFYITPLYTLSGTVFSDTNKDASPSAGEGLSAWSVQISGQGVNPSTSTDTNGAYSFSNLKSGNYTVKLTQTLPAGYSYLVPKPPSWSIYLGNPSGPVSYVCSTGGAAGATCGGLNNGSISGLNFSVTNENTFIQPICSDARFNGGYSQLIPSTANCGGTSSPYAIYTDSTNSSCSTNPGILYGGSVNPNYGTGLGASTPTNQVVGNANYPENFTSPIPNTVQTSYSFVMTSLNNLITAPTPLSSVCPSLSSCDLSTLSPGVYTTTKSDGPVTFLVSNPSSTLTAGNYTFVIGNDITFTTKVLLPSGSSAFFTSGGNIHVTGNSSLGNAGEVGESNWNSVSPDLEGFFSADGSFYIDRVDSTAATCNTDATPIDNKLNIKGSVVVNAAGAGGSVVTNRDGCVQDKFCPTVTFTTDPLQILHTPTPLKPPYTVWKELNP